MKESKCWPEPRNGGGGGIPEGRKHMKESGDQKKPPVLDHQQGSDEVTGFSVTPPKTPQPGNSETCSTNSAVSGTKAQCGKLLPVSAFPGGKQGPRSHWAAKQQSTEWYLHWKYLAPCKRWLWWLITRPQKSKGKTPLTEELAFSFQNKMGSISSQGSTRLSSTWLIHRLYSSEFSQEIFPATGTKDSGSSSNILCQKAHHTPLWSFLNYPEKLGHSLLVSPQKWGKHTLMSPPDCLVLRLCPICSLTSKWVTRIWSSTWSNEWRPFGMNSRAPRAIAAGRGFMIHF